MRVDLHLHTTASDGHLSPAELARQARAAGLDVIAVTDHDTVAGIPEAREAAPAGLTVIPAIEISASHEAGEQHILGYGVDLAAPQMLEYSTRAGAGRRVRMTEMIEALGRLGVDVDLREVVEEAGSGAGSLGRPHLARVLVKRGHAEDFSEAFERFLGDQGPAYVPTRLLDVAGAIRTIHQAGGVAIWAHPAAWQLDDLVDGFASDGLDGIECLRPRYSEAACARLRAAAAERGLLLSGGSDWHGPQDGPLGAFSVDGRQVAELLELTGATRP